MSPPERKRLAQVDASLRHWRQGDCVIGEQWFAFRVAPDLRVTDLVADTLAEEPDLVEASVFGFSVVTQTCDIVRNCADRPFIEVCPLVKVDKSTLREIERGYRPNYAYIPGVSPQNLVADLERVMTVEKPVAAQWQRTQGCFGDEDARRLSLSLARKRARFAFPDEFVAFANPLKNRMSDKHGRQSSEGRALKALREIRVRAAPSWDADEVELMFWFIRDEDALDFEHEGWEIFLEGWLKLIPASGQFGSVHGSVVTLDALTAREYVESDRLDLDHLSRQRG